MKSKLLLIILSLTIYECGLVGAFNEKIGVDQIIEIDNERSNDKAINTSNPNIIAVEQYKPVYMHYIKNCRIDKISDKNDASIEYYFNDDLVKGKNTLLITLFIEKDYKVDFNCTDNPLVIKSLSQSEFNTLRINIPRIITQINTTIGDISSKFNISEYERKNDSKKLEGVTNWTKKQDEKDRIEECKEKLIFPIRVFEFIIGLGLLGNFIERYRKKLIKKYKKHKLLYSVILILLIIFIFYFEFSKNPFFC